MRKTVSMSIDEEIVSKIDKARGLVTRSRWVESILGKQFKEIEAE
jgi:metal-responsive CopG/Arc/MetJ family transcriptional regulator